MDIGTKLTFFFSVINYDGSQHICELISKKFHFTAPQSCVSYLQLFILCSDLLKVLPKFLQLTVTVLSQLFVLLELRVHFLKLEKRRK